MNYEEIINQLDDHIDAIPNGTLGELLKAVSRLIADQDETIVALTASETMRIAQLKKARKEIAKLKKGGKRGVAE
jgi:hypothetical protein